MLTLVPHLSTRFHRDLASPGWLQCLATHVETAIAEYDEFRTFDGDGVVYSAYNEERYMGPLSVVKYYFRVEIEVGGSCGSDDYARYQVDVEYCPATGMFRTREETIDTEETRRKKRKEAAQNRAAMESAADKLREYFEKREAIYVEKGVLRVRLTNIRAEIWPEFGLDYIAAEVEEIPTVGFENGLIQERLRSIDPSASSPLHWHIGTSDLHDIWEYKFGAGYGGFTLYFAPQVIQDVIDLAAQWPDELGVCERYDAVARYLCEHASQLGRKLFGG